MAWLDEVREIVEMGAEAHQNSDWLGIVIFWIFALITTALLVGIGVSLYFWLT